MKILNISLKLASILLLATSSSFAQTNDLKYCGQTQALKDLYAKHPEIKQHADFVKQQEALKPHTAMRTNSSPYIIPVVFHIMHQYGSENISDAQVIDAVRILNEDYQLRNADTSVIVQDFKSLKADINFEFRLAKRDPNGNCTNGILHVESSTTNVGDDGVKFDQWDPSKYLNIWVVKTISSGAAGYAYYPSSADGWPAIDGIVILSDYVGSIGSGTYFRARALTHEVGHYMDLEHVWGSTNNPGVACGDDGVMDTPETKGWSSCQLTGSVCNPPIIENVQNYMEYAYCSKMFTLGQKQRMHNAVTSTIANRNNLWSASNLVATGTDDATFASTLTCKPEADFKANTYKVCVNSNVTFTDASYNGNANSWSWTFTGGTPSVSTSSTQVVSYANPGTYAVKLKVSNSQGADSLTKTSYITVSPVSSTNYSITEGFETINLPASNWVLENGQDNYNWQIASTGATGTKSIRVVNTYAGTGDIDLLYSPSINMNGSPNTPMSFKVAFAQKQTDNTDKLRLLVSKNCGQTWSQIYAKTGSGLATTTVMIGGNWTPTAAQWRTENITVPYIFLGTNTMFKFEFTGGDGNNIYLDDINIMSSASISELSSQDFGIVVYPNPASDFIDITINSKMEGKVSAELVDVLGKTVYSFNKIELREGDNSIRLNTTDFAKGLYFINVVSEQSKSTQKILIQ